MSGDEQYEDQAPPSSRQEAYMYDDPLGLRKLNVADCDVVSAGAA